MLVGYLPHTFDLLNVGDLDLIQQARTRCEHLVLGVLSDDLAERLRGRRPFVPLPERMALVSHVRGVDKVLAHADLGTEVPPGARVFRVAGQQPVAPVADAWVLTPARHSASATLRDALEGTPHALPVPATDGQPARRGSRHDVDA